jgi:hypothetical protein
MTLSLPGPMSIFGANELSPVSKGDDAAVDISAGGGFRDSLPPTKAKLSGDLSCLGGLVVLSLSL